MKHQRKFLISKKCGNQVSYIKETGHELSCCGEQMDILEPNTVDASKEKHVPAVRKEGDVLSVCIGDVEHPMLEEHFIEWIAVAQDGFTQRRALKPGQPPKAEFHVDKGTATVYAYCNLHGLWAADVDA